MSKAVAANSLANAGLSPRGLSREQAAAYLGISASTFDALVADGRMPKPKRINDRKVWDIRALDSAFERLPDTDAPKPDLETVGDVWDRARA